MYPDINININLPGVGAGAAQVAADTTAMGPPPDEADMMRAGGVDVSAEGAAGMPPGPEEVATDSAGDVLIEAGPGPEDLVHEGDGGAEGAMGFMPPGPDLSGGNADLSTGDMSGEPPGPEADDAPKVSDVEGKAAKKK